MFAYPKFKGGKQLLTDAYSEKWGFTMMNISVYRLKAGEELSLLEPGMETAVLLLEGKIVYFYDESETEAERESVFKALPVCLHAAAGHEIVVRALTDAEILVQSTENERDFPSRMFFPADVTKFVSCDGKWENTAVRDVVDIINIKNSPYSNMVLGEVYARQGRWWSYIPHYHPQPEVYYYKFARPEGFGACFIGDKAYTVKDGSVGAFPGGLTHAQVTAPGYPMYCAWMIRHLPGDSWDNTRTDKAEYTWLNDNPDLK